MVTRHTFLLCFALAVITCGAAAQTPPPLKVGAFRHVSTPPVFAENRGQWNSAARFLAQLPSANIWVGNNGTLTFDIFTRKQRQSQSGSPVIEGEVFGLSFGGGSGGLPQGITPQSGKFHYLTGNNPQQWIQNAALFQGVEIASGRQGTITVSADVSADAASPVTFTSQTGAMTITAEFASGAQAAAFMLRADGKRPAAGSDGSVVFATSAGTVTLGAPTAWQQTASGGRQPVLCAFTLTGDTTITLYLDNEDPFSPIVVAVPVLFSAVAGGASDDMCYSAAIDTNRIAYITGETSSADYPTSQGAYNRTIRIKDCFVTKFNAAGTGVSYSTFLGGSGDDLGYGIAVDAAGSAYVTGSTTSNDFPATAGAFQTKRRDNPSSASTECFVAKLTPDGSNLVYATYVGGKQQDVAKAVVVDFNGFAYIGGTTSSGVFGVQDSFPITANAFSRTHNGGADDGFVAKIGKTGATLEYCSYLGGNGGDYVNALALGADGTLYATGETISPTFPHTPFTIGQRVKGQYDCFITKFSPKGDSLRYSVTVGGAGSDGGAGIAVDIFGNAFVTGYTESLEFPATQGALDTAFNGTPMLTRDAFILKLAPSADSLLYSTFFGGLGNEEATGVGIDVCGAAYISGSTTSAALPLTSDAVDATLNNGSGSQSDAFLAKINSTGNTLIYSTYLGGSNTDEAKAIAVDATGAVYVAGTTLSGDFQRTAQVGNLLKSNAFLTKIQVGILPLSPEITASGPMQFCDGGNVTLTTATNYRLYQWKFNGEDIAGATAPQVSADKNGRYTVAVTDASGCTGTKEVAVTVFPKPVVFAGRDTLVCPDSSILLRAISKDSVRSYRWSPAAGLSNTTIPSPLARPSVTTDYIVTVTDTNNCTGSDTIRIVVVDSKHLAVRQFPDTLFACPGDSLRINADIFNSGEASLNVAVISSDPRFRAMAAAANVPAADSTPANLVFVGSPQGGTFSTRVTVTDICGNAKTADIAVFVGRPDARTAAVADTTVCLGETAVRRVLVRNAARPPATLHISGGGGKFSASPAQILTSGKDSSLFSIFFSGDTIAGTHRSTFYIDDQCGGRDSVTVSIIVKGTPLVILPSGVTPDEAAAGIDRTVNINASDLAVLNESPDKTLGFTLLYDKTTLVLDSITSSQCAVSVVRPAMGKALVRLENCAAVVTNPLATAKFRTVVGETLTPAVQITGVIAGDKCIAAGTSPAEIVKMLPYGCEIRTLNVQLFASALLAAFPSPANDILTVEYATVEEAAVRIALVGALGQTVAVITDTPHKPGVYQARFPADRIPAGSYILTMDAGQYRNATPVLIAR